MANFTYANAAVVSRMYEHLQNTMFPGVAVSLFAWCYNTVVLYLARSVQEHAQLF